MKKFFSLMIVMLSVAVTMNAQTTVRGSKLFDNMYVGVNVGATTPLATGSRFFKDMDGVAGVEIGKNITPITGFSLAYDANLGNKFNSIDLYSHNLRANVKFNLTNLFLGYNGQPRRVELQLVPGIGWGHDFIDNAPDANYITYNAYAQLDFNLGKKRAWQINIKPGVTWAARDGSYEFNRNKARVQATIGLTYKFGNKRTHSHNFVLCPYTVTQADYDAVVAQRDEYAKRPEKVEIIKEKEVIKEQIVEKKVYVPTETVITFPTGSAKLTKAESAILDKLATQIPSDVEVRVIGSADSKTGTSSFNAELCEKRAALVAEALKARGVKVVGTSSQLDTSDNARASRAAVVVVK